jgi:hypothetical protein
MILSLVPLPPAAAPPNRVQGCVFTREFPLRIKRRGVEMRFAIGAPDPRATSTSCRRSTRRAATAATDTGGLDRYDPFTMAILLNLTHATLASSAPFAGDAPATAPAALSSTALDNEGTRTRPFFLGGILVVVTP